MLALTKTEGKIKMAELLPLMFIHTPSTTLRQVLTTSGITSKNFNN